jgi:hypothetical protein
MDEKGVCFLIGSVPVGGAEVETLRHVDLLLTSGPIISIDPNQSILINWY